MKQSLKLTILILLFLVSACSNNSIETSTPALQPFATPMSTATSKSTTTLIPLPDSPLDVTVTKDLVYAKSIQPEEQREWKLDVYAPSEIGHWPVVLFLPGRGQIKEVYAILSQAKSKQGAIVFVIDYPVMSLSYVILINGRGYRELTETVACAIRFARAGVLDLGSDAKRVTLAGFSFGGGVGSHVALVGGSLDRLWEQYAVSRGGPTRQVDCKVDQGSTHVDAFVGIAGPYDAFVGYDGKYGREFLQEKDPNLQTKKQYDRIFPLYRDLYDAVININSRLSALDFQ